MGDKVPKETTKWSGEASEEFTADPRPRPGVWRWMGPAIVGKSSPDRNSKC